MRFVHQQGVAMDGMSDVLYAGADAKVCAGGFIGEVITDDRLKLFDDVHITSDPVLGNSITPYRTILVVPVFDGGEALNWVFYMRTATHGFEQQEVEDLTLQANLVGGLTTAKQRTRDLVAKQSELEAAMANLRETQNRLIAQEKLASLGALTAGIAHEIRNPLNFVTNFATLSETAVDDLAELIDGAMERMSVETRTEVEQRLLELRSNAAKIREHGQRANSIVQGMLGHARQRRGESAQTDVNALVEEFSKLAYYGLGNGKIRPDIDIVREFADGLPRIQAVPPDLGRAVLNVVTNACQAVEARRESASSQYRPTIRLQTSMADGHIEIRVRDNGIGMDAATVERALEPFFTTKAAGAGTGLGLSIVHTIVVQEHHGSLDLKSQPGEYTEVIMRLPTSLGAFGNVHRI
jgi:signal transduction histidine kinase